MLSGRSSKTGGSILRPKRHQTPNPIDAITNSAATMVTAHLGEGTGGPDACDEAATAEALPESDSRFRRFRSTATELFEDPVMGNGLTNHRIRTNGTAKTPRTRRVSLMVTNPHIALGPSGQGC